MINRVASHLAATYGEPATAASVSKSSLAFRKDASEAIGWVTPIHYEPNYAYPLIVWLHGNGGDHREIHQVMPHISLRNFVGASVCAPDRVSRKQAHGAGQGYIWKQTNQGIEAAESRVIDVVRKAAAKYNIHHSRIYLAGFEAGGTMALRLAMRTPSLFGGAISLCGGFPAGMAPLAHLAAVRDLPLMVSFGRDSKTYSVEHICKELPLLHTAGLKVALRQYPCADEINTKMLQDVNHWVMEQVTGMASSSEDSAVVLDGTWN